MGAKADVRRTALGFTLIALAAIGANISAYVIARSVERESLRVADDVTERSYSAERMSRALGERFGATYAYVVGGGPSLLEDIGRTRASFRDEIEHLKRHVANSEEAQRLDRIEQLDREYRTEVDHVIDLVEAGKRPEATRRLVTELDPLRRRLGDLVETERRSVSAVMETRRLDLEERFSRASMVLGLISALSLLLSVSAAATFGLALTRSQRALRGAMDASEKDRALMEGLLSAAPDLVILVDRQMRVRYASLSTLKAMGVTSADVLNSSLPELPLFNAKADSVRRAAEDALTHGTPSRVEGWAQTVSGEAWFEYLFAPILHEGRVDAVVVNARELTQRKQFEASLQESSRRVTTIVESITDAFISLDRQWRFTYVNREAEKLLGRPREQLEGRSKWELFPELRGTVVEREFRRAVAEGVAVHLEEFLAPLKGWIEIHAYPSDLGLSVYFRDISERKRTEGALRLLTSASAQLAELLDADPIMGRVTRLAVPALANAAVLCLAPESDGPRVFVSADNPAKERLLREMLFRYPPSADAVKGIGAVMRTGTPELYPKVNLEAVLETARDAEHLKMLRDLAMSSFLVVPVRARGQTLGALALCTFNDERRLDEADQIVAQQLADRAAMAIDNARLYETAQRAVRQREEVLAVVSHDLRNPLHHMSLAVDHALRYETLDPAVRRTLERCQRSAHRMGALIHDLLDFSSALAGQLPLERAPQDVRALLEEAKESTEPLLEEKKLKLEFADGTDGGVVDCDRDRFHQVVMNLVGNAIKFSPEGGVIRLEAERAPRGDVVMFTVKDQGPGVPPEQVEHIFDRYWRGGGQKTGHGTGLGLSIVKGIVEQHGGRVWLKQEAGGARFCFTLPVARIGITEPAHSSPS